LGEVAVGVPLIKEALENQANLRENRALIAD